MKTSGSMTAVLKPRAAPGLEVARVEIPALGPHDVLIKVQAASICGTDLHIYKWDKWAASRIRPPLVFGHEFCGEVVAIGELVSRVTPAAFVSVEGHIPDGTCFQCLTGNSHICENLQIVGIDRPGCFAEYVAVPETERLRARPQHPARGGRDPRPVRQRRAHDARRRGRFAVGCGAGRRAHRLLRGGGGARRRRQLHRRDRRARHTACSSRAAWGPTP